jgi:3-deoxy-D-manno-octulosonic-acid transferase
VYDKYIEGVEMVEAGGAFSIEDALELEKILDRLFADTAFYQGVAAAAGAYVQQKAGATGRITRYIQENRLLTS